MSCDFHLNPNWIVTLSELLTSIFSAQTPHAASCFVLLIRKLCLVLLFSFCLLPAAHNPPSYVRDRPSVSAEDLLLFFSAYEIADPKFSLALCWTLCGESNRLKSLSNCTGCSRNEFCCVLIGCDCRLCGEDAGSSWGAAVWAQVGFAIRAVWELAELVSVKSKFMWRHQATAWYVSKLVMLKSMVTPQRTVVTRFTKDSS